MNIKAVAHYAGISVDLVRAWERRYQLVCPKRLPNGRRDYDLDQAEHLKLIACLVGFGHRVSLLKNSTPDELRTLAKVQLGDPAESSLSGLATGTVESMQRQIEYYAETFSLGPLIQTLRSARTRLSSRSFILELVVPLVAKVGELVGLKKMDIATEHALTALLRAELGQIAFLQNNGYSADPGQANSSARVALTFSSIAGDFHDLGILMAAALASSRGAEFTFLGADLPASALVHASRALGCKVLVISATASAGYINSKTCLNYLEKLHKSLSGDIAFWVAGSASYLGIKSFGRRDVRKLHSLDEFDRLIVALGY